MIVQPAFIRVHHHVVLLRKRGKLCIGSKAVVVRRIAAHLHIVRILRRKRFFLPKIKRKRAAKGHEKHRGKDADRRKAGSVLPHAVEHARNRNEVLRPVIKSLVGPKRTEHRNAAGGEKQIRGQNDEQDQKEEDAHRRAGAFHRPCKIICSAEHRRANERHGYDKL